jgi:O-antigen ligase
VAPARASFVKLHPRPRRGHQRAIAVLTIAAVLLAYMPIVGRVSATSAAVSESRVAELALLGLALAGAAVLRTRSTWMSFTKPIICLLATVGGFALWAMMTSFVGPLVFTGVVKAGELFVLTFVSLQIAMTAQPRVGQQGFDIGSAVALSTLLIIGLFICENMLTHGTPLPTAILEDSGEWSTTDFRERLVLGPNHPLASGLMIVIGTIFAIGGRMSWKIKLPTVAGLWWLLHLCDARGIEAGFLIGLVLMGFRLIPPSPFRLLFAAVLGCGAVLVAILVTASVDIGQLVVQIEGKDSATLNGRTELWEYVLSRVPESPLFGVGYYSSRMYILDAFPFAGHAHNSMLEVLYSTGIIGGAFLLAFHAIWIYSLFSCDDPVLLGLTPVMLFQSNLSPIIFTPDVGMFLMLIAMFNALLRAHPPPEFLAPRSGGRREGLLT